MYCRRGRCWRGTHGLLRAAAVVKRWFPVRPIVLALVGSILWLEPVGAVEEAKKPIRVGVSGSPPFVIGGQTVQTGISVEVWQEVATRLNQTYVLVPLPNTDANLQALLSREVDLAIGPISITPDRLAREGLDFSQPYFHGHLGLLVPTGSAPWIKRLAPFFGWAALSSLGVLMLLLFLVGNLIWLAERRRNYEQFPRHYLHGVGNGMWFALVTLTTVGYGDRAPLSRTGRTVAGVWMLLSLLALSSVTAGLASAFTLSLSQQSPGRIQQPDDLTGQSVAVVRGTTSSIWAQIYGAKATSTSDLNAAIGLLKAGRVNAVMFDRPALQYFLQKQGHSDFKLAPFALAAQTYGFAFPDGSALRVPLDVEIVDMVRSGRIKAIEDRILQPAPQS